MQEIPKQAYTTEFKERAIKHAKEGKSTGHMKEATTILTRADSQL